MPSSTSTTASTTTSLTPPGAAVAASSSCVLGWWDGEWHSVADDDWIEPPAVDGQRLQAATLDGVGDARLVELHPYEDIGSPAWSLEVDPPLDSGVWTGGSWNPVPHIVETSSDSPQAYIDQTAQLMGRRGYPNAPIELAQVIRTDLEGDGVHEVIVAARHPGATSYLREEGVFSLIFLRRVIEGEVETAILHDSVFEAGDVGLATSVESAEVAAVADLNGDGVMEIAIDGSGYEWYWSEVFEYVDDDLGPVSRMLCGGGV